MNPFISLEICFRLNVKLEASFLKANTKIDQKIKASLAARLYST